MTPRNIKFETEIRKMTDYKREWESEAGEIKLKQRKIIKKLKTELKKAAELEVKKKENRKLMSPKKINLETAAIVDY